MICENSLIWESFSLIPVVNQAGSTGTSRKWEYLLHIIFQGLLLGKLWIWRVNNICVHRETGQKRYLHFTRWRNCIFPWTFWCPDIGETSQSHPLHISAGQTTRTIKTGIKWNCILMKTGRFRHLYLCSTAYSTLFLNALKEHNSHIA